MRSRRCRSTPPSWVRSHWLLCLYTGARCEIVKAEIVKVDADYQGTHVRDDTRSGSSWSAACAVAAGLGPAEAAQSPYIASMGIYVFKKDVLVKLLKDKYPHANDFGGEIIPWAASDGHKVTASAALRLL